MSELMDTPIKLFGWTITSSLVPVLPDSFDHGMENSSSSSSPSLRLHMMNNQSATGNKKQDNTSLQISSDLNKLESKETSENSDDQHSEITSEITTTTTSEEKTTALKKPDKILPCPRCTSGDTKFCYYNNYNVNQPRHFCRNCQRYWTSGGSMRTVPVGSGRRKNKGWVSTDHMHINSQNSSSDYTNNYNTSSTKILNFESSDSFVNENGEHQSSDGKITANSVSQDLNKFQGFLPPQVTSPVSPPWPYQYPLNPSFYHIPVYWGCTEPFLVYSRDFHMSRKKRTRDEVSHETVGESKDTFVRARLDSSSERINNEASVATENHVWYPVPMKREKTEQFSFFINGSASKSSNNRFVPETCLNLKANPAAMARSMTFRESM